MEFSRQEYWSELPSPSPGDLPNAGIEPWSPGLEAVSCMAVSFLTNWVTEEDHFYFISLLSCLLAFKLLQLFSTTTKPLLVPELIKKISEDFFFLVGNDKTLFKIIQTGTILVVQWLGL